MAPRKSNKKPPVGVLAPKKPKQKWQNPQADVYVGANAPVFGGGDGGLAQTYGQTVGSKQDGFSQALMDAFLRQSAPSTVATSPGLPVGMQGLNTAGPAVTSSPTGQYALPGYAPTDAQANSLMQTLGGTVRNTTTGSDPVRAMIAALAAAYQRQMANLDSVLGQAQTTGTNAADAATAAINANPSPYQNIQLQHMADQSNPLAAYMQALGTNTGQIDATLGLMNSMNQTQNAGIDQLATNLGTINQNARNGVLNDIERSKQAFIQQLAQQRAAEELALKNYSSSPGVRV